MTDIHSHIIFDIDDGSSSIEESIALIKRMSEVGFDNIIATPHYIENSKYCSLNHEKLKKLEILCKEVKKQHIPVNLYLGNEIFIHENIVENIKKNYIYTLNNSKYLLFELPFHNQILNLRDTIYEIKVAGFIPILAHPERYDAFQKDYSLIEELKEDGLLFQCNYSSILGYYGKNAKKLFKRLLKDKYVNYLGTDIHHINKTYVLDNFSKITKKIIKYTGEEYYQEIINNCDNLIKEELH